MRISVTIFIIVISTYVVNASVLDPVIENVIHLKATKPPPGVSGIWKKKTIWKPRWVKEWKSAKVMKPVWRKVWSPIQIREWLPIPKPPPGWDLHSTPLTQVQPKPQKALPVKDSQGHDSSAVHSSVRLPLWDPVPYPESQQPPPVPGYDPTCGQGCDSSPSQTFNQQQIQEIIGTRYQSPETHQNPEYSETVNHLTRLPPEGNNWRPPQDFNTFSVLPEFLVPPKIQALPENNIRLRFPNTNFDQTVPKWTPLPPENKIKGHFITKDQPYKFQIPEPRNNGSSSSQIPQKEKPSPQNLPGGLRADGDFIQEAQLVGEYHYSEFDLPSVKQEQKKPTEVVTVKPEEKTTPKPVQEKQTEQPEHVRGTHVQKKHIPDSSLNNFRQEEEIIRQLFPIFKRPANPSTKLHSVTANPVYEAVATDKIPDFPNHRFSPPRDGHPPKNATRPAPVAPDDPDKPDRSSIVQLVFATTDTTRPVEGSGKTTTTEPYEIIFSSSLQSTTEVVTKSPVVVVTPANYGNGSV